MRVKLAAVLGICVLLAGCRGPAPDPLPKLSRGFDKYPQYSIILSDMEVSGTFFTTYQHRYKILYGIEEAGEAGAGTETLGTGPEATKIPGTGTEATETPGTGTESIETGSAEATAEPGLTFKTIESQWIEVDERFYKKHENHLGMVLFSKGDGGKQAASPPGYRYVGNSHYGTWRTDSRGSSFWEFYGKYHLFSSLMGGHSRPIYRSDYDSYQDHRRRREPYFGAGKAYGTTGSVTRATNPKFYERQQVRQRSRSERFAKKARTRTSSARSRSGGRGK